MKIYRVTLTLSSLSLAVALCGGSIAHATVWNAGLDFNGSSANPNGVWSYDVGGHIIDNGGGSYTQAWTPNVATYVPATYIATPLDSEAGYFAFDPGNPPHINAPWIYANSTNPTDPAFPYGKMGSHPNGSVTDPNWATDPIASAVEWKSPISGTVKVEYDIYAFNGDAAAGIQWGVYLNSTPIFNEGVGHPLDTANGVDSGLYTAYVNVNVGDVIYFLVAPNTNAQNGSDQSAYLAIISTVPEPATGVLLMSGGAIGLLCFGCSRRRRARLQTKG
jgi:hypothetical protein